jgi:hypothetical protein
MFCQRFVAQCIKQLRNLKFERKKKNSAQYLNRTDLTNSFESVDLCFSALGIYLHNLQHLWPDAFRVSLLAEQTWQFQAARVLAIFNCQPKFGRSSRPIKMPPNKKSFFLARTKV